MFIFDLIKMINISVHSSETKLFSDEEKYRIGFFLYSHVTCKLNFNILHTHDYNFCRVLNIPLRY